MTTSGIEKTLQFFNSPWRIKFFYLTQLPTMWFYGVRVKSVSPERTEVTIRFNWRTKNPFRSIYAGALFSAGELTTGLLAFLPIASEPEKVSMLCAAADVQYLKKAVGLITYTCEDGAAIQATVQKAKETMEGQTVRSTAVAKNEQGDVVATLSFVWTFKARG